MFEKEKAQIEEALSQILAAMQLDLVELAVNPVSQDILVEILADKASGGISLDECTALNRALSEILDRERWLGENFMISVCSPGLDRPLKTSKDFLRNVGRPIRVHLKEKLYDKWEHQGKIQEIQGEQVILQTKTETLIVPLNKIQKAVQIL